MSRVRRISTPATLGAALLIAALTACSSDSTSPNQQAVPDAQVESDVAASSAGQAASDAADYANADQNDYSSSASAVAPALTIRTACQSITATFQLVFADNADTLNVDRTRTYFSADGCQSSFDASTTDSVEYTSNDSLDLNGSAWTDHLTRARAFSLSGAGSTALSTDTVHYWNGVGQGTDTSTYSGLSVDRSYGGAAYDTATTVSFPHPRTTAWPSGGTIARWVNWMLTVTGARNATIAVQRHVVVTFNGTQLVPLQVYDTSSGALKLTCTLDLLAHRIVPGSCH